MGIENPSFEPGRENADKVLIEVESGYESFVPAEFGSDPLGYFESQGKNIKSGEVKRDETGTVREDPTAVKELPVWIDADGKELRVVGKRVNVEKGKVGESGDPFYEYRIMEILNEVGLPAPRPIAKAERSGTHLIVMEKVQGVGWYDRDGLHLKEKGYTDEDIESLMRQAQEEMARMQALFEEAGIRRGWKLKDMIFEVDIENKKIGKVTPVDWERTKIDQEKLEAFRNRAR